MPDVSGFDALQRLAETGSRFPVIVITGNRSATTQECAMRGGAISLITLLCLAAGFLLGMWLQQRLPDHHLSKESQDTVKLGSGMVATMSALILGLFAPRNATVFAVLLVCAFSVSSAMFLILEMSHPLDGLVKVSNAPMLKALELIGH